MLRLRKRRAAGIGLAVLAGSLVFGIVDASSQGTGPATRSHRGAMPAALLGKWGFAAASGDYCDPLGNCAPGSGGSISFTFRADGRAEYSLFQSSLVDGCGQIQSLTLKTGTVTMDDATIVFTPKAGSYRSVNGCRPDLTGLWKFKPGDLKPVSLRWELEGRRLRLTDPGGEASGVYGRK
ncbi:hypothetical protein [Mesorhizobium neociceri]|uniref:Uncharacterized protein n=1 Tax=Mesorhizobium neociceri TaxID=1307853 RepID=A0A838BBK3_9HYPH|nr:hypothetical protein [Mesorhizobium neociceri]MBA1143946.1 hypothetical protein [Mesorhizobium neociceri]